MNRNVSIVKCSDTYLSFMNHVNACWHLVTIATVTILYIIAHLASSSRSETRQFYWDFINSTGCNIKVVKTDEVKISLSPKKFDNNKVRLFF